MKKQALKVSHWLVIALFFSAALLSYLVDIGKHPRFLALFPGQEHLHEYAGLAVSRATTQAATDGNKQYLLGTSAIRQSVWRQQRVREVLKGYSTPYGYSDLHLPGKTPLEAFFLVYLSNPKPNDQYYYVISGATFTFSAERNYKRLNKRLFHLSPETFYRTVLSPSISYGALPDASIERYHLGHFAGYFIKNSLRHTANILLFDGKRPTYQRFTEDLSRHKALKEEQWERVRKRKTEAFTHSDRIPFNVAIIKGMQRYLESRGATLTFIAIPIASDLNDPKYSDTQAAVVATALKAFPNVPYVDLNKSLNLTVDDFNNPVHTNQSGRDKWAPALIAFLAAQAGEQ